MYKIFNIPKYRYKIINKLIIKQLVFKSSFKKKIKERIEISKLLQHLKDSFAKNQTKSFLYVCNAKKN